MAITYPVIRMLRPRLAFSPVLVTSALQPVRPTSGSAAPSTAERCAGATSTSSSLQTMYSCAVPASYIAVPPMTLYIYHVRSNVLRELGLPNRKFNQSVSNRTHHVPVLLNVLRPVGVGVPAPRREQEDVLILEVAHTLRAGLDYRPVAVCQQRVVE